nr:tetratricopeptide repeat protein [Kibdelosporangium sp. MJ126-NF4]CEL13472.1 putative transcriptional regulator [Kibdelosporangium sp. MJ126-NF4]CTQ99159.1 putative transcriptional regulator [Kibdelosporangium sp. MJ126-NF4]
MVRSANMPNTTLSALLTEAGWSGSTLASRVNAVAAEGGLVLRLDRRQPSSWLAGRRPRPPIPELVAEALSRQLSRPVTITDTGLVHHQPATPAPGTGPTPVADPTQSLDVATVLMRLITSNDKRRQALTGGVYRVRPLALPTWTNATRAAHHHSTQPKPDTTFEAVTDAGPVTAAEQMARVFTDADASFGGGYARRALAAYLAHDIAPRLHTVSRLAVRTRLLTAATKLSYQCAFMCFDDQQHGLAQHYYQAALDLAAENGDSSAYAITLRALSVQASFLGHHREAVQLAETAVVTNRKFLPERQAFLYGQVAVAAAGNGDRTNALSALHLAERRLNQATSTTQPLNETIMGAYHPAALFHQQAATLALLGDRKAAITALAASNTHRPTTERRSRAIINARLAELHLDNGNLESAAAAWHAFLDDYPHLTSRRVTASLKTLRSRIRPHTAHLTARRLLTRAFVL